MKFERISTDSDWWAKILARGQELQRGVEVEGPFFWKVVTFEDGEIYVLKILMIDSGTLYYTSVQGSDKIPFRMVKEVSKDRAAEKKWNGLPDTTSKESFAEAWSRQSTFRIREWA